MVLQHSSPRAHSKARKSVSRVGGRRSLRLCRQCASRSGGFNGSGFESGLAEGSGANGAYASSSFESASYTGGNGAAGFDAGLTGVEGGYASSNFESSSFTSGAASGLPGFDVATATFNNADKNKDGGVDADEFKQFYQGGL